MKLAFKDVETGDLYEVGAEAGAVLGRERARCDIAFGDESISKRHARLAFEEGGWWLHDLQSSNGTYVRGERIGSPTPLRPGVQFSLAQRNFEVVRAELPATEGGQTGQGRDPAEAAGLEGPGSPWTAPARAMGRFLFDLPRWAVLPGPTLRSGPGKTRVLSPAELALYGAVGALLATGAGQAVSAWSSGFAMPWNSWAIALAIAAAVGGAVGLIAHPLLVPLIRMLGGSSDAASRSEAALTVMSLGVFAAVIQAGASTLSRLWPGAAPVVFAAATVWACLLLVSAALLWSRAFGLYRGVQWAWIGLGGVALTVTAVSATLTALRGSQGGVSTPPGALAALQLGATGSDPASPLPPRPESEASGTPAPDSPAPPDRSDEGADEDADAPKDRSKPAETKPPEPPPGGSTPDRVPLPVGADYPGYLQKRKAIETLLDRNPSLLRRGNVRRDYEALWERVTEIERRWKRRKARGWRKAKIEDRLRNAEVYEETEGLVNRLYERLRRTGASED
jgi:hypothetical protein